MKLKDEDLIALADVACEAAREAGALIASYRDRKVEVKHKAGGDSLASQVVTEVDGLAEGVILRMLGPTLSRFDLALLTEETADDGSRHRKDYFWCVDPLDGTLSFTQGIPGYSVSIALVRGDGVPMIGVVYDPVEAKLYRAVYGQGIAINGIAWDRNGVDRTGNERLRLYCDCTFEKLPSRGEIVAEMEVLAERLDYAGLEVMIGGGAVLNACWVLEKGPSCYFKKPKIAMGGGSIWDFAATACLFAEAKAYARDFTGEQLELNRAESSFMNHRGVCYATDEKLGEGLRGMAV